MASRRYPVADRARVVVMALHALAHDLNVVVDGRNRGRLRAVSNDWQPRLALQDGGSNMLLRFLDGSTVPAEDITAIEVVASAEPAAA